jgi:chromosome segregation ATPase
LRNKLATEQRISETTEKSNQLLETQLDSQNLLVLSLEKQVADIELGTKILDSTISQLEDEHKSYNDILRKGKRDIDKTTTDTKLLRVELSANRVGIEKRLHAIQKAQVLIHEIRHGNIPSLEVENRRLGEQVEDLITKTNEAMSEGFIKFQSRSFMLTERLSKAKIACTDLSRRRDALNEEMKQVVTQRALVLDEIRKIEGEITSTKHLIYEHNREIEHLRHKTIGLVSEKACVNAQLASKIKQYTEYEKYSKERQNELSKLSRDLEAIEQSRLNTESEHRQLAQMLQIATSESMDAETEISSVSKSIEKRRRDSELKKIRLDKLRSQFIDRERKIAEAVESNKSSDFSLSLKGKKIGLEKQYESLDSGCQELRTNLLELQKKNHTLSHEMDGILTQRDTIELKRYVVGTLLKRKNFALEKVRSELRHVEKEIVKFDRDLSKMSTINVSFEEHLVRLGDSVAVQKCTLSNDSQNSRILSFVQTNDAISKEIEDLSVSIRSGLSQKSNLAAKIDIERKVLDAMLASGRRIFNREELVRKISNLSQTLGSMKKKRAKRQREIVALIEKKDTMEQKFSSRRSIRGNRTMMSCSTLASSTASFGGFEYEHQINRLKEALDEMNSAIDMLQSGRRDSLVKTRFKAVLANVHNFKDDYKLKSSTLRDILANIAKVLGECCDQLPSGQPENPLVRDLARWNEFNIKLLS